MKKIAKIFLLDNFKSKVILIYFLMLALISWTSLILQDTPSKGTLTILNIVLFIVPLMSLLYSVIYLYNAHEFIVMLLSQPLKRKELWGSLYIGISSNLLVAFLLGVSLPAVIYTSWTSALMLSVVGCAITMIFVSLAFLTVVYTSDKTKGIGAAILLWLFVTMIWDSVALYLLFALSSCPIEKPIMGLMMLNPLDLARFQIILQMDSSAMMGFSGAAFKEFLGTFWGMAISVVLMLTWIILPYLISLYKFKKKDL